MKIIALVIIISLLQSCAIHENFDDPFEGLIEDFIDEIFEKHHPDSYQIMSGYELMERAYNRRQNEWQQR